MDIISDKSRRFLVSCVLTKDGQIGVYCIGGETCVPLTGERLNEVLEGYGLIGATIIAVSWLD